MPTTSQVAGKLEEWKSLCDDEVPYPTEAAIRVAIKYAEFLDETGQEPQRFGPNGSQGISFEFEKSQFHTVNIDESGDTECTVIDCANEIKVVSRLPLILI